MNIDDIKKIELEITSHCNAACPGCSRTRFPNLFKLNSISFDDIKRLFPDRRHIEDKRFKFCGVLGDPIVNPDCFAMVEYLTSNGGYCQLSTNAGYNNKDWWYNLGKLSAKTNKVDVVFAVDGHKETNHIYRVNTVFSVIERNMLAYSNGCGDTVSGTWMFIVFDHNEHELEIAKEHATKLGFKFATRTGIRNSINDWIAKLPKKKGTLEKVTITTTGDKEHSKKNKVIELQQFINTYSKSTDTVPIIGKDTGSMKFDDETTNKILKSIVCKTIHEGEIFIASDLTMWPCCFLWQNYLGGQDNIRLKLEEYGNDWNDLKIKSINDILNHPWFSNILEQSWNPTHSKHLEKCIRTCGNFKAYQNEIKFIT